MMKNLISTSAVAMCAATALGGVNLDIRYLGIPDFDQVRTATSGVTALPGNGTQYCVPASALNFMAFIANRGFPALNPGGPRNWQVGGTDTYNLATFYLNMMGNSNFMDTNPATGTTGDNHQFGVANWLSAPVTENDFQVTSVFSSSTTEPSMQDVWAFAEDRALVMICIGWYTPNAPGPGGVQRFTRNGGHVVSLVRLQVFGTEVNPVFAMGVRDPGDEQTNQTSQSLFTTRTISVNQVNAQFRNPGGSYRTINKYRFPDYTSGASIGFLDGYVVIHPRVMMDTRSDDQTIDYIQMLVPQVNWNVTRSYTMPGVVMRDVVPSVDGSSMYIADQSAGGNRVLRFDPTTQTLTTAATLFPDTTFHGPLTRLAVNPRGRVYMLSSAGRAISWIDPAIGASSFATLFTDLELLNPVDDMIWHDGRNRLMGLSINFGQDVSRVYEFGDTFRTLRIVPLMNGGSFSLTESRIAYMPNNGHLLIAGHYDVDVGLDNPFVREYVIDPVTTDLLLTGEFRLTSESGWIKSISSDHRGRVFVTMPNGHGYEYRKSGGIWSRVVPSVMDTRSWQGRFSVSRSRTNFDPVQHDGPGWEHVVPSTFPPATADCAGDANVDGKTNGADLSVLLAQFGLTATTPGFEADLNGDAVVNGADLSVLLANFGCDQFQ